MKAIVLAGSFDQIALIKELKGRSYKVILIDYLDKPLAKDMVDKHYLTSTLDVSAVKEIALKEKVDLITTACTDQALLTVAQVSEELSLPCYLSYQTAKNVTNKSYMKGIMQKYGIPTPKYKVLKNIDTDCLSEFNFPLVIKPVDCNSSKGVKKIFSVSDIEVTLKEALKLSRTNSAIIEEFKKGSEISVDVYVENGTAKVMLITESTKIKNSNGFTIMQSKYPVNLSNEVKIKIDNIVQKISEAFKIDNSPMLVQLITDGSQVNVLEFSARMGGGTKYKLIEKLAGVNIMSTYVDLILGKKPGIDCSYQINYAHLNYCYCNPGTINKLENFDELKQKGIIEDYFQYKPIGTKIEKAETSTDRAAGYLIIANTLEELKEKEKIANAEIKIISEDGRDIFLREYLN